MKDKYAYPSLYNTGPRPGMELRDWFAGMALNGMLAEFMSEPHVDVDYQPHEYACMAYAYADAVMKERDKGL